MKTKVFKLGTLMDTQSDALLHVYVNNDSSFSHSTYE